MVHHRRFERLTCPMSVGPLGHLFFLLPPRIELGSQASEARILSVELQEQKKDVNPAGLGARKIRATVPKKSKVSKEFSLTPLDRSLMLSTIFVLLEIFCVGSSIG